MSLSPRHQVVCVCGWHGSRVSRDDDARYGVCPKCNRPVKPPRAREMEQRRVDVAKMDLLRYAL